MGIILSVNLFPKITTKRGTLILGFLIYTSGTCIIASTKIQEVILTGFAFCGLGFSITLLPTLPEILDTIEAQEDLIGKYDKK